MKFPYVYSSITNILVLHHGNTGEKIVSIERLWSNRGIVELGWVIVCANW